MPQTLLEIVSPERLLLSREVDMVVIPGAEGELGALYGTAPMIVALNAGTIRIYAGDRVVQEVQVQGGFAEIIPERCTVLATEASLGSVSDTPNRPEAVGAAERK